MQNIIPRHEIKTCQNQRNSCKRSNLQALCVDPNCSKDRNLCINCLQDHKNHSMIDYVQLIALMECEEKSNNEFKKLSLKLEQQFKLQKSVILRELEDQEQKLRKLINEIRTQYTTFNILQQLTSKQQKLTYKQIHQIGTQLSTLLTEKQQGEREYYEVKQVEFEKTDQYLPIQSILNKLAFSTYYLTQNEQLIQESLKSINFYQQFAELQNNVQVAQTQDIVSQQVQQYLRQTSIQDLKTIDCSNWLLNEYVLLQQLNIMKQLKPIYKEPFQLDGHLSQIRAVAISQNEEFIASGDQGGKIILWKLNIKQQVRQFQGECTIQDLSFSYDNKQLAAAQFGKPYEILLYDLTSIDSNEPKIRLKGHTGTIQRIQFTQNSKNLISGSQDKSLMIWQVENSKITLQKVLSDRIYGISISSNQYFISACCGDGQVYLFDSQSLEQLKQVTQWQAHQSEAIGTAFTPDSKIVLTCYKEIKLWSINQLLSGNANIIPLKIFEGSGSLWSINLLLNGQILVSNDGQIKLWSLNTDQLICNLDVPGGYQYTDDKNVVITQNLNYIVTGGRNCKLKLYERKNN